MRVRVAMAHAALAWIAEESGCDVLHIKGAAADAYFNRSSWGTDADVLVRPAHLARYLSALRAAGWKRLTRFETDSDFGAAATFSHSSWGFADVHRFFPGVTAPAEVAFEHMWRRRLSHEIAEFPCPVPDVDAQSVILVLNAARSRAGPGHRDVDAAWNAASAERRHAMTSLVAQLGAQVAFAAGTGDLERFRGSRQYRLWRIESRGGGSSRTAKWLALIWAAPTARDALRRALRAPLVNTDHLTMVWGRRPSRVEVLREFVARPVRGIRELTRAAASRLGLWRRG